MNSENEFECASCKEEFVGDPIIVNGSFLCLECKNEPLYTRAEIADFLSGWAYGDFDEVQKIGQRVCQQALFLLRDPQDGIETQRVSKR